MKFRSLNTQYFVLSTERSVIFAPMPQLSVVVITLNEEKNIGRCLASVQGVADDIVVVDSNSTDRTAEICKEFNVNFITKEWEGYAATKNYANAQAKHDWILSLDADEALSDELKASILKAKEGEMKAYQFNRLTNYCSKWIRHGGWYPDVKLRIFDRRKTRWEGIIHEVLVMDEGEQIGTLQGDLQHYSFHTIEQHVAQSHTFAKLKAQQIHAKGKRHNLLKVAFAPAWKFFQQYFLKLGFLDGYYGFVIAKISARAVALRYVYLKELQSNS